MSHEARLLLEFAHWSRVAQCAYSRRIWAEGAAEFAAEIIGRGC